MSDLDKPRKLIDWKLYKKTDTHEIYMGFDPNKNEYLAASDGPPYFYFVGGTLDDVTKQVNLATEFYKKYKAEKDATDSKNSTS
jgi:hypothetical protein